MAVYNLNYGNLESLIDRSFSPGTENAIIDAIKSAGIIAPSSGKIGVRSREHERRIHGGLRHSSLSRHRREQHHHGNDHRSRTDCGRRRIRQRDRQRTRRRYIGRRRGSGVAQGHERRQSADRRKRREHACRWDRERHSHRGRFESLGSRVRSLHAHRRLSTISAGDIGDRRRPSGGKRLLRSSSGLPWRQPARRRNRARHDLRRRRS